MEEKLNQLIEAQIRTANALETLAETVGEILYQLTPQTPAMNIADSLGDIAAELSNLNKK